MSSLSEKSYQKIATFISAVALIIVVGFNIEKPNSAIYGMAIGHIVATLLIFVVAKILSEKASKRNSGGLLATILVAAFCVVSVANSYKSFQRLSERKNAVEALVEIRKVIDDEGLLGLAHPEISGEQEGSAGTRAAPSFPESFRRYIQNIKMRQIQYAEDFTKIGWAGILDPERLREDHKKSYAQSRSMIFSARGIVLGYEKSIDSISNRFRAEIQSLSLSKTSIDSILRGYDESFAASGVKQSLLWEAQIISLYDSIISLLARSGYWFDKNGSFVFDTDENAKTYNKYISEMMEISVKQQQAQLRREENTRRLLNQVDDLMKR